MVQDLKTYYRKIRELQKQFLDAGNAYPIVISVEDDSRGFKGGVMSEVDAYTAGKLITDHSHRTATAAEMEDYQRDLEARREKARQTDIRSGAALLVDQLTRGGVASVINPHLPVPAAPAPAAGHEKKGGKTPHQEALKE